MINYYKRLRVSHWLKNSKNGKISEQDKDTLKIKTENHLEIYMLVDSINSNWVTSLNISNVGLAALPQHFAKFKSLTELNISGNIIQNLNVNINSLQTLDASKNNISVVTKIPVKLENLDLCCNSLKIVPPQLFEGHLKSLILSRNHISIIEGDKSKEKIRCSSLKKWDLSENEMKICDLFGFDFPKLNTLNVSKNKISSITEHFPN